MHLRAALRNGLTVDEIKEVHPAERDLLRRPRRQHRVPDRPAGARRGEDSDDDRLRVRRRPDAVRPVRRRAGRASAPTTSPRPRLRPSLAKAPAWTRARSTTWSGATPTGPARTTATSAGWRCCSPGSRCPCPATTVNRLCGSSLDAAMTGSRTIESGDADVVLDRRRGVDDPRAVGAAQAVARLPGRQRHRGLDHAGLAAGQRRMPTEWTVSLGEANELLAEQVRRSPASGRTSSPPARTRSPTRPGSAGFYDDLVVPVARRRPGPRRGHPRRLDAREARRAQAVVPAGRAPSPRATPRRSTTARPRCCSARRPRPTIGRATRRADRRAGARTRWSRRISATPRSRPPRRRWPGPASAGPTSARSSSTRPSPCSRWPASTPGRSTRRSSTPRAARSPSATRWAPRAAASSARSPTAARVRRPLGRRRDLHRRRPGTGRRPGERRR